MQTSTAERVQKHRANLRASGLRPVQIWVPDTNKQGFAEEVKRQCLIVAKSDSENKDLQDFMDSALADTEDWE